MLMGQIDWIFQEYLKDMWTHGVKHQITYVKTLGFLLKLAKFQPAPLYCFF